MPTENARLGFPYFKLTISSIVQMWLVNPAAIAGVLGYGLASVLCGREKMTEDAKKKKVSQMLKSLYRLNHLNLTRRYLIY